MFAKVKRSLMLAVVGGSLLQFGGCGGWGGDSWFGRFFQQAAIGAGIEFVLDNDGVFDLFEDGTTGLANP